MSDNGDGLEVERIVPWERNFREQMVRLRKGRGLTQTDLARRLARWGLPFHQQTIQRIENGQRPVRLNEAKLIARELDVGLDTMMSTATANGRAVMQAVDEVRSAAARFAEYLNDSLEELGEAAAQLILVVGELLDNHDAGSASDPALVYGFMWANHLWELYVHAIEALNQAVEIEEGREVDELIRPEFEVMKHWFDMYDHLLTLTVPYPRFPELPDEGTGDEPPKA